MCAALLSTISALLSVAEGDRKAPKQAKRADHYSEIVCEILMKDVIIILDDRRLQSYRYLTMIGNRKSHCSDASSCPPAAGDDDLRPVEGPAADEELSSLTRALGHPARVRILRILARRKSCVCGDIVDEFDLAQSTVSQHLKILKDAGLIRGEIDGPRTCYCIDERTLRRLKALVATI